ncbi:hypothetical protein F0U61_24660 [Archangium violaceum]|uniref:hypothetical protein n=1 Tax=Archangium violaceum TaxID=83451 RepID=UPI002B2F81F7|nr:hypothetical protein F0U61_24660 [Archangium violaceum]
MKYTMLDYLRVAEPHLPAELVSPEAFADIAPIARALPPCTGSGFECRLGEPDARADFLVRVQTHDGTRGAFAGRNPDVRPPAELLENPVWRRVFDFCARWSNPENPLHADVEDFWLEFDVAGRPTTAPTPAIFFGPRQEQPEPLNLVALATGVMRGEPGPATLRDSVRRCYEALPPGGSVYQVGMMLSRPIDALRLCVRGIPTPRLTGYLREIGWDGPTGELDALLSSLAPHTDRICLALDVGERVFPKLGLECYVDALTLGGFKERWKPLLEHLVGRGLCRPEKRDALLSWMGLSDHRTERERWPPNLVRGAEAQGPGTVSLFMRYLNHVKLVFQPGAPLEAKAYPGLKHLWGRAQASAS